MAPSIFFIFFDFIRFGFCHWTQINIHLLKEQEKIYEWISPVLFGKGEKLKPAMLSVSSVPVLFVTDAHTPFKKLKSFIASWKYREQTYTKYKKSLTGALGEEFGEVLGIKGRYHVSRSLWTRKWLSKVKGLFFFKTAKDIEIPEVLRIMQQKFNPNWQGISLWRIKRW